MPENTRHRVMLKKRRPGLRLVGFGLLCACWVITRVLWARGDAPNHKALSGAWILPIGLLVREMRAGKRWTGLRLCCFFACRFEWLTHVCWLEEKFQDINQWDAGSSLVKMPKIDIFFGTPRDEFIVRTGPSISNHRFPYLKFLISVFFLM